jgi:hypothetical protein
MKKRSRQAQIDQTKRSSTRGKRHFNARAISELRIPESVAKAYDGVQSLITHDGDKSLEELQGAVEYLLDRVKAARGLNG